MGTGQVSVNQAIKAIAIARGYLEENKIDLTVSPVFRNEE
jgi:stage V sporulation protein SpoVS